MRRFLSCILEFVCFFSLSPWFGILTKQISNIVFVILGLHINHTGSGLLNEVHNPM